jgi:hypothetical protein
VSSRKLPAAGSPSIPGSDSSGPACSCYPANETCPSEAACQGLGHPEYLALVDDILQLHKDKSAVAELTGQPRYLYPVHRSIEKLTRVLSLHAQGRTAELEEEFVDVASLLLCAAAVLREDS